MYQRYGFFGPEVLIKDLTCFMEAQPTDSDASLLSEGALGRDQRCSQAAHRMRQVGGRPVACEKAFVMQSSCGYDR